MKLIFRPSIAARLGVLLALSVAGTASAQGGAPAPQVTEAVKRLATDDARLQRERFGDLAAVAGKPWMSAAPGELATLWRDVQWIVPGAAMRFQRGFCVALRCEGTEYLVRYDADAKQLEFLDQGAVQYTGRIQEDGSVRMKGTALVGVLTAETLRFDAAANVLYAGNNALRPAKASELSAATHGFVPDPGAAAPQAAADAELRAELAAMKAKVDALSKQVEQQQAPAQPEHRMTPAEAREAQRRAQREAKARAAAEKRLAAEAKVREQAERRAQARAEAKRQAEARAEEARRIAEEKRAAAEAKKRAIAEAKAAEAQRIADAGRAKEEARKAAQAAPAPAADGLYTTDGGYTINVKFEGNLLIVKEPNKDSPYHQVGPGYYEFTNPTNGIPYCMRVIDTSTLEACKPGQAQGMGTRLTLASGGGGGSVPSGERKRFQDMAHHYAVLSQQQPSDAQTWSFCSFAALAQATGGGRAQLVQAATALRSISTSSNNPCSDAIPDAIWSQAQ